MNLTKPQRALLRRIVHQDEQGRDYMLYRGEILASSQLRLHGLIETSTRVPPKVAGMRWVQPTKDGRKEAARARP